MNNRLLFVFNPASGKGRIRRGYLKAVFVFVKNGWDVTVHTTKAPEDAFQYIKEWGADYSLIVVSGGDGTLSECIHALMDMPPEQRPELGYIPTGTTNDFASNMKMSKNIVKAAKNIMKGNTFKCDIGRFNSKNFIYVAAFGAFTDVAYDTPQESKNILGHLAYLLEGVKRLSSLKTCHIKVKYDGGQTEGDYIYGMVSNTNYLGGFKAEKAFAAQLNDGLFEVILVKCPKNFQELHNLLAHLAQQNLSSDAFTVVRTNKVKFLSEEEIRWTLDGEFGGAYTESNVIAEKEAVTFVVGKRM